MAKASVARNSFNAGEFSRLVEGRVDLDRYPASMRVIRNFVAAPQGPAIRRSGTQYIGPAFHPDVYSRLVPFVYNETQSLQLEFLPGRVRFWIDNGLQVYNEQTVQVIDIDKLFYVGGVLPYMAVGQQVFLAGFPNNGGVNGETATILAIVGNNITIDRDLSAIPAATPGKASVVYHVNTSYDTEAKIRSLRAVQNVNTIRLFSEGVKPCILSRYDGYDWRFAAVDIQNGPFMPVERGMGQLNIQSTGQPVPSAFIGNANAHFAFDGDIASSWDSGAEQAGVIGVEYAAAHILTGYVIYPQAAAVEPSYTGLEHAPGTWVLEGRDGGGTWHVLDSQTEFQAYEAGRSIFIDVDNSVAYFAYRWTITAAKRNGPLSIRASHFSMRFHQTDPASFIRINLTGASTINRGQMFLPTDVGRLVRIRDTRDNTWRITRINSWESASTVVVNLLSEGFVNTGLALEFQLGYYSDTTGYPVTGEFFDDRLWMGGSVDFPDLVSASRSGAYDDFATRTTADEVLDDSALAFRLNTPKLSGVRWIDSDERGLLIGSGSREHIITAATTEGAITSRNIKLRSSTQRGSAKSVEQVKIDRQVLFLQTNRSTLREFAYQFEVDGYKAPSMSLFASHLGAKPHQIAEMAYAQEPHSIIWCRRDDGTLVGLTYNRDENVIGWHTHDVGGFIDSISVIPSPDGTQDIVWMIVKRNINGVQRKFVEKLTPFWDFGSTIHTAFYVDCGLRYLGLPTNVVTGVNHLNGVEVEGLCDGVPFRATVVDRTLTVPLTSTNIVFGLPFESYAETSRIEAGAADGTSQGKEKRINGVVVSLWDSAGGEIGRYNEDQKQDQWADVEYAEPYDELQPVNLQTDMFGPITPPSGYGKRGSILFRQTAPLPFNVVALLPQLNTQDR